MKNVAAILVALCLTHTQDACATVKVLRKSVVTTDKMLAFGTESYTDEHLTYALCDKRHPESDDVKCTVIREKQPYGNDTYACDVTLKRPHHHNLKRMPYISVYPFGQKYAALKVWEDRRYRNYTVVQMDSCKVSEAGFRTNKSHKESYTVPIVGHTDSFDVFFKNADLCGDRMCKATIGADGRIINEPKPSIKKFVSSAGIARPVVALDNGSSGNGYFYLTRDGNDYIQVLVKPDGTEKSLARHPKPSGSIGVSTKNNLLGVCYQMYEKFECSQYDFDGNLKLRATITSGYDNKIRLYFDLYNLPNGGFYVFGGEFVDFGYPRYLMERVDADGTKTGPIIFQGFDNSLYYKAASSLFYENNPKEVCTSLAATQAAEEDDDGRIKLTANCFSDADFSN